MVEVDARYLVKSKYGSGRADRHYRIFGHFRGVNAFILQSTFQVAT
jgi:hypothetical protein